MQQWIKDLIFYEIYPNSFKDSDGDGYGDLPGIISKLDYVKDLGANAIWLNPHFESAFKDGGYDVVDFFHVAKRFGTDEDFKKLIEEMHKRDMKLIIDLVAGHTSEDNPVFIESAKPERNEYSDMFIWTNSVWYAPSNYKFMQGRFERDGAYMVNFFSTQPALNYGFYEVTAPWQMSYKDPRVKKTYDFLLSIIFHYLEMGVDGFRVDMADSLVKNDPEKVATIELWQSIFRDVRARFPKAIFVSEWSNPYRSIKAGFDIDFMLDHWHNLYNDIARAEERDNPVPSFFKKDSPSIITNNEREFERAVNIHKDAGYIGIITCNHDTPRPNRYLDEKEIRLFYTWVFTMPGVPFLYYGDEIGMTYQSLPSKECGFGRTGSRTPMQWDDSENQGFSSCKKEDMFLPVDHKTSFAKCQDDPFSLYYFVKDLIRLRNENESLKGNDFHFIYDDEHIMHYKRNDLRVIINPTSQIKRIKVGQGEIIFTNGKANLDWDILEVGAQSSVVYKTKQE